MSKTPTRLYTVKHKSTGVTRLVESTTTHAALGHVVRDEYTVDRPDPKTVANLVIAGVVVETAGVYAAPSDLGHSVTLDVVDEREDRTSGPGVEPANTTTATSGETSLDSGEELYRSAVSAIRAEGLVSVSFVQRHLQLGYNHAARLVERMEQEGIVSAPDLHGVRTLLPTSA